MDEVWSLVLLFGVFAAFGVLAGGRSGGIWRPLFRMCERLIVLLSDQWSRYFVRFSREPLARSSCLSQACRKRTTDHLDPRQLAGKISKKRGKPKSGDFSTARPQVKDYNGQSGNDLILLAKT